MITIILEQIISVLTEITKSKIESSKKSKKGCAGLYSLYLAVDKLIQSSQRFINALKSITHGDDAQKILIEEHKTLVEEFESLYYLLNKQQDKLAIFNKNLSHKIDKMMGLKADRLRFWVAVLEESGVKLKTEKRLAKLQDFKVLQKPVREPFFYHSEAIALEASISLENIEAVKVEIRNSQETLDKLIKVKSDIANFIKLHCEYSDLFD